MSVTQDELYGLAMQALNMAKTDCRKKEWKGFLLASYHAGEGIHRMRRIEQMLIDKLGEDWLNHPRGKEAAFGCLRLANAVLPPDAFLMVTATNMFKPTEKLLARPPEEMEALRNTGHDVHHQMVKDGLLTLIDSLTVFAQTPEYYCNCTQEVERGVFIGQPMVMKGPQSDIGGRTKMFGNEHEIADKVQDVMKRVIAERLKDKPPSEVFDFTKKQAKRPV